MKGTLREGFFSGDPERYVKYVSKIIVFFYGGTAFGEQGGALLS
jgi:hypothetical protein